jgi:hypothetical protein
MSVLLEDAAEVIVLAMSRRVDLLGSSIGGGKGCSGLALAMPWYTCWTSTVLHTLHSVRVARYLRYLSCISLRHRYWMSQDEGHCCWPMPGGLPSAGGGTVAELVMMTVDGDGEGTAVFEVDGGLVGSDLELAADDGVVARAQTSLRQALDGVRPALSQVSETVRELKPDEMEIEFGLKIGGESGVIIAKGTAEVNFAVRVVWKRT